MSKQNSSIPEPPYDVVVVGSGNAGACAALAASETGARVLVVEKAPRNWAGGNSYFSAGAFRTTYGSLDELRPLLRLTDREAEAIDLPPYSVDDFVQDMVRVTQGRTDPSLARIVAEGAADVLAWLQRAGIAWELLTNRQSFEVDGRRRYWGNLSIGTVDGGRGLVEAELRALSKNQIEVWFDSPLVDFEWGAGGSIVGVRILREGHRRLVFTGAVVLASGGFESDARLRASFLGPGWDLAKVRGTPFNTGDGLMLALDAGAEACGHWTGCHAIAWDAAAPPTGDRSMTNRYSRQGYPFGLMVNQECQRFVDEGADFRNYTYAKYGAEVLRQPGSIAYQLFDAQSIQYLNPIDYNTADASRAESNSIRELAADLNLDPEALVRTVESFNLATGSEPFDPTVRDGKRTYGLTCPRVTGRSPWRSHHSSLSPSLAASPLPLGGFE